VVIYFQNYYYFTRKSSHRCFILIYMRIFLIGFMGCGKTTVGKRLSSKLGLKFLDLDQFVEEKYGKTVTEQFSELGEQGFRERERDAVVEVSTMMDDVLVSTGGGAPCFYNNMDVMRENGITIYLKMTPNALASRLKGARKNRPLLQGKTYEELVDYIALTLNNREPFYDRARIVVSALSIDVDGLVNRVYHIVK
jgi:shikimate kinase